MMGLPGPEKSWTIAVWIHYTNVTDGQTDRQTDRQTERHADRLWPTASIALMHSVTR